MLTIHYRRRIVTVLHLILGMFFSLSALGQPLEYLSWQLIKNVDAYNVVRTEAGSLILPAKDGVYRSLDNGNSWSKVNFPSQGRPGVRVGAWGGVAGPGKVFVNTLDDGIYLSTDDGVNWIATGPVNNSFGTGSAASAFNGRAYVAGYGGWPRGMYRWNGSGWTKTAAGRDGNSVIATPNGWFFALFDGGGGIHVSKDDGLSWAKVDDNSGKLVYAGGDVLVSVQGDGQVFRSPNLGESWSKVGSLGAVEGVGAPIALDSQRIMVSSYSAGRFGTTWMSDDRGTNWRMVWTNGAFNFTLIANDIWASTETGLYRAQLANIGTPRVASATAQVVNGFLVGCTIVDGGNGYDENPIVTISGGSGFGAKATATQVNGVVTSITITNPGSGYTSVPTITIAPPPFPPRKATATSQVVNGFVVGATVKDSGFGYATPPAVLLSGGGGSGATATATVVNGMVTGVTITNPGTGYTSAPNVLIASPPFAPSLAIEVSKVTVRLKVVLGRKYQLEASTNLNTWAAIGPAFVAQAEELVQEFDVNQVGRYFRINQVP